MDIILLGERHDIPRCCPDECGILHLLPKLLVEPSRLLLETNYDSFQANKHQTLGNSLLAPSSEVYNTYFSPERKRKMEDVDHLQPQELVAVDIRSLPHAKGRDKGWMYLAGWVHLLFLKCDIAIRHCESYPPQPDTLLHLTTQDIVDISSYQWTIQECIQRLVRYPFKVPRMVVTNILKVTDPSVKRYLLKQVELFNNTFETRYKQDILTLSKDFQKLCISQPYPASFFQSVVDRAYLVTTCSAEWMDLFTLSRMFRKKTISQNILVAGAWHTRNIRKQLQALGFDLLFHRDVGSLRKSLHCPFKEKRR
jgi:hypothetical protein